MRLPDVREHLLRECTFPIRHEALIERVGDVQLDAHIGRNYYDDRAGTTHQVEERSF